MNRALRKRLGAIVMAALAAAGVALVLRPKAGRTDTPPAVALAPVDSSGAPASLGAQPCGKIEAADWESSRTIPLVAAEMKLTDAEAKDALAIMTAKQAAFLENARALPIVTRADVMADAGVVAGKRARANEINAEARRRLDALLGKERARKFNDLYYQLAASSNGAKPGAPASP